MKKTIIFLLAVILLLWEMTISAAATTADPSISRDPPVVVPRIEDVPSANDPDAPDVVVIEPENEDSEEIPVEDSEEIPDSEEDPQGGPEEDPQEGSQEPIVLVLVEDDNGTPIYIPEELVPLIGDPETETFVIVPTVGDIPEAASDSPDRVFVADETVNVIDEDVPLYVRSEDENGEPVYITEEEVPLASLDHEMTNNSAWALINLILAALTVLTGLVTVGSFFRRACNEESGNIQESRKSGKFLGAAPPIVAVIAFVLTEDMTGPMVMTDGWTIFMALIFAASLALAYVTRGKKEKADGNA